MVRRTVTRSTDQPGVLAQSKETLVLQLVGGRHLETTWINQASLRVKPGRTQREQISSEMRSTANIPTEESAVNHRLRPKRLLLFERPNRPVPSQWDAGQLV
jgi:hypothetical protein